MGPEEPLPPLKTLQQALRVTTERLAGECGRPLESAPRWDPLHWRIAQAASAIHGVSPLLWHSLRWPGPPAWHQFLHEQWRQTHARQQAIASLIAAIDARARSAGIGMTALKGAALHDLGIYACGMRPMADLDLLVWEQDATATTALLERMGHLQRYRTERERTFEPDAPAAAGAHFGESADRSIKIELHTQIAERLPIRESNITQLLLPQRDRPGIQRYRSMAGLMSHLLLHAAGNMRTRSLRLIQLHDISALSARLGGSDWQEILEHARGMDDWWLFPPLALTARYYPSAIPPEVLACAGAACPRALRRAAGRHSLSDVSLSQLWIEFCPGMEWCGSIAEKLRYMRQRAFPGAVTRAEMRRGEATQLWASGSRWTRLPRPWRIARWLVARRPRVPTLWSVKQAWRHAGDGSRV